MAVKIYHGDILFTPAADRMEIHENSYIIVEDGVVSQICEKIPETYSGVEIVDYGDKLIIPAFSDLHVHGAQYVQRGIGMDCLLSDWLNHYTFPQESRFQSMEYAKNCYDAFVDEMILHGTFHANVFATIHRDATKSPTTSSTGGLILALQRAILLLAPQGGVTSTFTGPL